MDDISQTLLNKITETENQIKAEDYVNDSGVYNKLIATLKALESRIKVQNPLLFNIPNITNPIQNNLSNLFAYTKSFSDSKNRSYINNINDTLNAIIPAINTLPISLKGETATNLNKILQDFENSNTVIIEQLIKEKDSLETQLTELKTQVATLEKRIETKNTELDNISSNQQNLFSAAQEKRLNDFSDKIKEFEKTFEKQKTDQSNNYSTTFDNLKSEAENKLKLMEEIKAKIEQIYSIVGQEAIVGSQKAYADKAGIFANRLFFTSITLMLAFAVVVIWPVIEATCNSIIVFDPSKTFSNLNWNILLCRLPIAALLLLPAVYMANESKKQRDKENKYRELEIKMAAIEPYFNNICEKCKDANTQLPEKDAVKLELAKQLLIPTTTSSDKNVIIPADVSELIENILKVVCKK
nr:MAG TPA: nucleoporin [Caudoviricetes sp.]